MKRLAMIFGAAMAALLAGQVLAHGGGTDVYGCHTDSRTGVYHCHPK